MDTDVISAYSPWASTPDEYVRALARHYPQGPDTDNLPRPALAIADYGLHSAVKTGGHLRSGWRRPHRRPARARRASAHEEHLSSMYRRGKNADPFSAAVEGRTLPAAMAGHGS